MNITHFRAESVDFYAIIFFYFSGKGFDFYGHYPISYTHYFYKTF